MVCTEIFQYYFETGRLTRDELVDLCRACDVAERDSNGYTPLHVASRFADVELIQIFLENGADPNAADNYGVVPLDLLARIDYVSKRPDDGKMYQSTVLLLNAKANPHKKDSSEMTCYHYAAQIGNWELVQAFCDNKTRLKGVAEGGENGLHTAAVFARNAVEKVERARKRLDKMKAESPGADTKSWEKDLEKAKVQLEGFFKTVKAFVDGGVDPDDTNNNLQKPVTIAKSSGANKIAAFLEGTLTADDSDEDMELKAKAGGMTLHEAAVKNDLEAVRSLIELGADLNEINDRERFTGMTPLAAACSLINAESIHLLTEAGADPNFKDGAGRTCLAYMFSYTTALHTRPDVFIENKPQKAIKYLIDAGLNINDTVDDLLNTALTCACHSPHNSPGYNQFILRNLLVDEFIRYGINVNAANINGQTALMGACLLGFKDSESMLLALLENGARTDVCDNGGNTPLMYASVHSNSLDAKMIADLLFDFGDALPDAVNNDGKTALDYATERNNEMLVKLILSKM